MNFRSYSYEPVSLDKNTPQHIRISREGEEESKWEILSTFFLIEFTEIIVHWLNFRYIYFNGMISFSTCRMSIDVMLCLWIRNCNYFNCKWLKCVFLKWHSHKGGIYIPNENTKLIEAFVIEIVCLIPITNWHIKWHAHT